MLASLPIVCSCSIHKGNQETAQHETRQTPLVISREILVKGGRHSTSVRHFSVDDTTQAGFELHLAAAATSIIIV